MTVLIQYLWLLPVVATVLIWTITLRRPYQVAEHKGGFECHPMFEVTARITIAAVISILVWLGYVAAALWIATHG